MKKSLLIFAAALLLTACGQKDNNGQGNASTTPATDTAKEKYVFPGVPVAPIEQIEVPLKGGVDPMALGDPNAPVLKLEEGMPLDFSQLQTGGPSVADQVASQIDSIRYKAEHGDAKYQYAYGVCYEKGWGVDEDSKEALAWYLKAANQGNGPAYNSLGNFYRSGIGVTADAKKAFEWYLKGAAAKDDQAMLNLGNCYYYGMGTDKDVQKAVKWWDDAAKAGNAYAMAMMGDSYFFGLGVDKDLKKAVEYYGPASDKGISSAQYRLGVLYYTGEGVEQDQTYAKLLMRKAADGGMEEAKVFLDKYFKD